MPGPPSAEVLNAQPREAGKGPGQPPAKKGHCGMRPAGTGGPGAPAGSGDVRAEQAAGSAGGDCLGDLAKGRRVRGCFL